MDNKNDKSSLKLNILLIFLVIIIAVIPIIFISDGEFSGADSQAEDIITEIEPDYEPWFNPIFEPPSGEIESLFFVLQGAIGAGVIGYYLGFMKSKKKYNAKD
jgi:cobalt/nickel transport protein